MFDVKIVKTLCTKCLMLKLMARLHENAPYMLYFTLWLCCGKWSCKVNILVLSHSGQVVHSHGAMT